MPRKRQKKRDYVRNPVDLSKYKLEGSELDQWQQEVMNHQGNIAIRAGRQVGKSFIMAKKAAHFAITNKRVKILISASSERQALYIYEKIKFELKFIEYDVFADTPTMRLTKLKNGTEIYCLPTGQTGDLIRGLTIDLWIPDEAAYIKEQVFVAVSPMLWVSKMQRNMGFIWALSTPNGKQGKFYEMFEDDDFTTWHVKSTECDRIPESELKKWKKTYTRVQYAQEVLGEFIDDVTRLFSKEVLDACFKEKMTGEFQRWPKILGVDVARYGGDQNAFVIAAINGDKVRVPFAQTTERVGIHNTFKKICDLEEINSFNRIIIDDAGVGGGLTDFLIEKFSWKILGANNATRAVSHEGKTKTTLKEDMYSNAIILMEALQVEIQDNDELYASLSSIRFEYKGEKVRIYGRNSHLAEAFVRALWGYRAKGLKLFIRYF